jgi:hypothetical protein
VNIIPGAYQVRVERDGFKTEVSGNLILEVDQTLRQDFTLQVGTMKETIMVVADAQMVHADSTTTGNVLDQKAIEELPSSGRDFNNLLGLVAGAGNLNGGAQNNGWVNHGLNNTFTERTEHLVETRRRLRVDQQRGFRGMMGLETWGARKALVVVVMGCLSMILAAGQEKAQTVAAKKDGRAEVDAHAAEWLKESDVPSAAVAYIEDRKVAWTAVYGEQSPGVPATAKTLYNMASLTKPMTAETVLRLASAGKLSLDEPMFRY